MKKVTKREADQVCRAVAKMFNAEKGYGPKVFDRTNYGDGSDGWIVSWEEGPYEWPYLFPYGGVDEELASMAREFVGSDTEAGQLATRKAVELPPGVWTEAINHYSIGLYREGGVNW